MSSFVHLSSRPVGSGVSLFNTSSAITSTYSTNKSMELSSFNISTWFYVSSGMEPYTKYNILEIDQFSINLCYSTSSYDGEWGKLMLSNTRTDKCRDVYSFVWDTVDKWNHISINVNVLPDLYVSSTEIINAVDFYFNGRKIDDTYPRFSIPNGSGYWFRDTQPALTASNEIRLYQNILNNPPFIGGLCDTRIYFKPLNADEILSVYEECLDKYTDKYLIKSIKTDPYSMAAVTIRKDGTLWYMRYYTTHRYGWIQISDDTDWVDSYVYGDKIIALKSNGTIWGYGNNTLGILGLDDLGDIKNMTQIGTISAWSLVSMGDSNMYAVKDDGIYATGYISNIFNEDQVNYYRNLYPSYYLNKLTKISNLTGIKQISSRSSGMACVCNDGTLWSCGYSYMGSGLGTASATELVSYHGVEQVGTDTDWDKVFCGAYYMFAIKKDGTMWATGQDSGQCAWGIYHNNYYQTQTRFNMNQIGVDSDWAEIACETYKTMGLKTNGDLYVWGNNLSVLYESLSGYDGAPHSSVMATCCDNLGNFTPLKCLGNFKDYKIHVSYSGPMPKFLISPEGMLYQSGYNTYFSSLYRITPGIHLELDV